MKNYLVQACVPDGVAVGQKQGEFRADINGLRAWAVVAVVLYHFAVPGFAGGFVGVDVFFVISGFLMTGIIISGLHGNTFSLWNFYLARARRIMPALLLLCTVVLALGWFLMMPREYEVLGRHARDSLLFTSNLRYLRESGYFESAAHEKWLLHTWSLSVEWQFYLLLPLLLMAIWRFWPQRRALLVTQFMVALLSLAWCIALTLDEPDKAFFSLLSRAWEMLAGGVLFLLGERLKLSARARQLLELTGIVLIVVSITQLDSSSLWPGWLTLLPVSGALLVLLARQQGSWLTGGGLAQWLGTRSYSIYLWHWPLVAMLAYYGELDSWFWVCLALLATLILGQLSYFLCEVPAGRVLRGVGRRKAVLALLIPMLMVVVTAQQVRRTGIPERLPEEITRVEAESRNRNPRVEECLTSADSCQYGGGDIAALVIGDSHADALVTAVAASLPREEQGIYFRGAKSCLVVFTAQLRGDFVGSRRERCNTLKKKLAAELDGLLPGKPVIVVNRASAYVFGEQDMNNVPGSGRPTVFFSKEYDRPTEAFLAEFRQHYIDTTCRMTSAHPVYLLRPIPEMRDSAPLALGRAMLMGRRDPEVSITREEYQRRHAFIWAVQDAAATQCGAKILDPLPFLCDDTRCHGSRDGWPLYIDDDHLSEFGNRLLVPLFAPLFVDPTAVADRKR